MNEMSDINRIGGWRRSNVRSHVIYIGTINDSNSWPLATTVVAAAAAGLSFSTFQQLFCVRGPRVSALPLLLLDVHIGKDLDEIVYRTVDPEEREGVHEQLLDSLALGIVPRQARTWDSH